VTALAMFYLRLIGKPEEIYQCLEPFYSDNRKLIRRKGDGSRVYFMTICFVFLNFESFL